MADVGGNPSGRSGDGHVPSYDAPTAPIPVVSAEDGTVITPRVPRRFPVGDGEETVLVRRLPSPGGPSAKEPAAEEPAAQESPVEESSPEEPPAEEPPAEEQVADGSPADEPAADEATADEAAAEEQAADEAAATSAGRTEASPAPAGGTAGGPPDDETTGPFRLGAPPVPAAPRRQGLGARLLTRIGDIPVRAVYSVGAALGTALAVFLIFSLFSGDTPADPVQVRSTAPASPGTPTPVAAEITLPALPRATPLKALPGTASPVLGTVTDAKAAISYAKLGAPWTTAAMPPFSAGQRAGGTRLPRAMAVSALLPGEKPRAELETDADFKKAALTAVEWTVRHHHPAGAEVVWTASQKLATGKGWVLGYKVTYLVGDKTRTSQAALALLDIGQRKPAMFFVTVPDTRKQLWADIAPLIASARAL
ncbi:hypothetical protein [Planomonospora venezuelensis]|uniref:Uncharacterized protein n=1 Tax=Planomonospora venezuelensis TaxID=1999 RepID=A0A841CUF0_PLAVE|nr:hypothetical protein [Planomonospora venezuelensis]MBB5962032.1 hypothetical protein [Planomonospora venezuelensis]